MSYSDRVEDDLARRDFTVNAMALEVPEPRLVDPHGGAEDLAQGRLRTPLAPEESFSDDPLRMMRAARFIAGYGLAPDPDLVAAVEAMATRLEIVSAERIRDELDKLIVVDDPSAGLWFLHDTGLAEQFLPELPAMRLEQDPIHHHKDVLAHTIAVVANVRPATPRADPTASPGWPRCSTTSGKPKTRSFAKGEGRHLPPPRGGRRPHDPRAHEGAALLRTRTSTRWPGWSSCTSGSTPTAWAGPTRAVRRFVRDAGPLLDELVELTRCDCTTRNKRKAQTLSRRMDELEERIVELGEEEELKALRPDLDGTAVMERLGVGPGPGRRAGHALPPRPPHRGGPARRGGGRPPPRRLVGRAARARRVLTAVTPRHASSSPGPPPVGDGGVP